MEKERGMEEKDRDGERGGIREAGPRTQDQMRVVLKREREKENRDKEKELRGRKKPKEMREKETERGEGERNRKRENKEYGRETKGERERE